MSEKQDAKEQGTKHDSGKTRLDLLDSAFIEGVGSVLEFGSRKYAANNWRKGLAVSRCLGAALRHIFAVLRGETLDPESGLPHLHHACCAIMFADSMLRTRPDLDDRWKPPMTEKEFVDTAKKQVDLAMKTMGRRLESPHADVTCQHLAWYDKNGTKDCCHCGARLPQDWGPCV